ncbi:MAG: FtsX-like permease family protein, partial [Asgard group archaeon]|nr:FtsX-like permease family protein [Asgard group archaeon]
QKSPQASLTINNQIQDMYPSFTTSIVESGVEEDLNLPSRIAIYAMLNSAFLTTSICTIAGLAIYSFLIFYNRFNELAIIRAVGGKKSEIFKAIIFESQELLLTGLLIGVPLGIGTSIIVSEILTSYYAVPPLIIKIPWFPMLIILGIIFIVTCVWGVFPAYLASRKEINDLARAT